MRFFSALWITPPQRITASSAASELVGEFPELREAMAEIGFKEIKNPVAFQLMGRVMTIPKGAAVKGMKLSDVLEALKLRGFAIKGDPAKSLAEARLTILKTLLTRLSGGEPIEAVRQDFVRSFQSVSATEIAEAEQRLIEDGMPVREVKKLCDLHSALFHGKTVAESEGAHAPSAAAPDIRAVPKGHPIHILCLENEALSRILDDAERALAADDREAFGACLKQLFGLYTHYGKKEMILMPLLYRYGVTGPSGVMWGVDDEIKGELRALAKACAEAGLAPLRERIGAWLGRIREMIYKEEKILFPLALRFFTEEEWRMVYRDACVIGTAFLETAPVWDEGARWTKEQQAKEEAALAEQGSVRLPTGEVSVTALRAILSLLPVDLTYIDKDDIFRFFVNEGRIFERPLSALGGRVENCHPAEVVPMIRQLLEDFKAKRRDSMEVWKTIKGKPVSVEYFAVRDASGAYMGTLEIVQDHSKALARFGKETAPRPC